jgi:type I restriction enzyme M protein
MRHFATESGKSKGQFYSPAEVSRVIAKVVGVGSAKSNSQTIHDPTCGSGSLLLKAHDEAKSTAKRDLALYGQEMDNATSALAHMNMILHDCPTAEIWQDNEDTVSSRRRSIETACCMTCRRRCGSLL